MIKLRRSTESLADCEHEAVVWNEVWPHERRLAQEFMHAATRTYSDHKPRCFLAFSAENIPIARGHIFPASVNGTPLKYYLGVMVRPAWRGQGVGHRMAAHLLEDVLPDNPVALVVLTFEDQPSAQRFLSKRGFEQKMRSARSEIDLRSFNSAEFMPAFDRLTQRNITITTFARLLKELGEEAAWSALYALRLAIAYDVPHYESKHQYPSETEWTRVQRGNPNSLPDATFIALHRNQWIGVSQLYRRSAMPNVLDQGITGVRRAYRRMGVATTLKLRTLDYAKRFGVEVIRTDNEENNPMYQLNLRLGFRPTPAMLIYEKTLRKGPIAQHPAIKNGAERGGETT